MLKQNLDQELRKVHKSIAKIVRMLDDVVDEISKRVDINPGKVEDKLNPKRISGINQSVLDTIEKFKKGVTIKEIKARTKLKERQVNNALYKLTKNGFVRAKTRGVYIVEEDKYRA